MNYSLRERHAKVQRARPDVSAINQGQGRERGTEGGGEREVEDYKIPITLQINNEMNEEEERGKK